MLQHKWVVTDDKILEKRDLPSTMEELKKFNAKRKFRAAAGAVSHPSSHLPAAGGEEPLVLCVDELGVLCQ